jgi:hypothetical protein
MLGQTENNEKNSQKDRRSNLHCVSTRQVSEYTGRWLVHFSRRIPKDCNLNTSSCACNTLEFHFTTTATVIMHAKCSHVSSSHSHKTDANDERSYSIGLPPVALRSYQLPHWSISAFTTNDSVPSGENHTNHRQNDRYVISFLVRKAFPRLSFFLVQFSKRWQKNWDKKKAYQWRSLGLSKLRSTFVVTLWHYAYFKTLSVLMGLGNIVFRFLLRRCLGPSHYNSNHVLVITPCSWTIRHWFSYTGTPVLQLASHMCYAYRVMPICRKCTIHTELSNLTVFKLNQDTAVINPVQSLTMFLQFPL